MFNDDWQVRLPRLSQSCCRDNHGGAGWKARDNISMSGQGDIMLWKWAGNLPWGTTWKRFISTQCVRLSKSHKNVKSSIVVVVVEVVVVVVEVEVVIYSCTWT
jgi:hypothetical protein